MNISNNHNWLPDFAQIRLLYKDNFTLLKTILIISMHCLASITTYSFLRCPSFNKKFFKTFQSGFPTSGPKKQIDFCASYHLLGTKRFIQETLLRRDPKFYISCLLTGREVQQTAMCFTWQQLHSLLTSRLFMPAPPQLLLFYLIYN